MKLRNITFLLVAVFAMQFLAIVSCTKQSSGRELVTREFGAVKYHIGINIDSLYSYPDEFRESLLAMQRSAVDTQAMRLIDLYVGICDFLLTGDPDTVVNPNNRVLEYCRTHSETRTLEGNAWNVRSILLQGDVDSMMQCLLHAYNALEGCADRTDLVSVCVNLADNYRIYGRYAEAAHYWHRALVLADSMSTPTVLPNILTGLGQTYSDLGRYDLADKYFAMADTEPHADHPTERYLLEMARGTSFYNRKDYDESLSHFLRARAEADRMSFDIYYLPLYINLAEIYTLVEQYDSAARYLELAREKLPTGYTVDAQYCYNSLAGDLALRQGRQAEAREYLLADDTTGVSPVYRYQRQLRLMRHYERQGDYVRAYACRRLVDAYDDSLRNVMIQANLAEISERYSRDTTLLRRDLMLSQSRAEVATGRSWIMALTVVLVAVLAGAMALLYYRSRKADEQRRDAQQRIARLRMQGVKNRISPHFIFNALNVVRPSQSDSHVFDSLIDVLRDNVMLGDSVAITLDKELRIVGNYVELYNLTHERKVVLQIDPTADSSFLVPAMSVMIPVENALKHAFTPEVDSPRIAIQISERDECHVIRVCDNGVGFDAAHTAASADSTGQGLRLLYRTIEELNRFNSRHITFEIGRAEEKPCGTDVTIIIPVKFNFAFE